MAESQVRQNYAKESEKGVNDQINLELRTMYTMLSMVSMHLPIFSVSVAISTYVSYHSPTIRTA